MNYDELRQWIEAQLIRIDERAESRHEKVEDRIDGLDGRLRGVELAVERVKTILETRKEQAAGLWDRWKYWVTTAIAVAALLLAWFKT